jgi:hypothetical protein
MVIIYNNGKIRLASGAQYAGEKIPGDLDTMTLYDSDINEFIRDTYTLLCRRAVTLGHSCEPVIAALNKHTDYAIGDGLEFIPMPDYETLGMSLEESIEWGERLGKYIYGEMDRLNFFEKQSILFRGALNFGDTLALFVREDGKFDIIEVSGLENIDASKNGEGIKLGIAHDKFYRRTGFYNVDGNKIDFVDEGTGRRNAVQFYIKTAPRQLRGLPLCYPVISLAKNDDRHSTATLATAIIESLIFATTESENPGDIKKQIDAIAATVKRKGPIGRLMESFGNVSRMAPGNMLNFKTGEKLNTMDKKTPGATFAMMKEWNLNYFGMGTHTPPEVMMSKYSTSYTAHKGALNDFQKVFMKERGSFVKSVCEPVIKELAIEMILSGRIKAPGFFQDAYVQRAYLNGIWSGPRLAHINPAQEVNADVTEVNAGFALRSEKIWSHGGMSYRAFMRHWQAEQDLMKEIMLPPAPPPPTVEDTEDDTEEDKETEPEEDKDEAAQEDADQDQGDDEDER